jgi:hypothetical protein
MQTTGEIPVDLVICAKQKMTSDLKESTFPDVVTNRDHITSYLINLVLNAYN